MTADLVESYRLARQAQDERFDTRAGAGAVDHTMTHTEEYRRYFGLGEWMGEGVETRITYKEYLRQAAADKRAAEAADAADEADWIPLDVAFRLRKPVLLELAADGDGNAAYELQRRAEKRQARRQAA